MLDSDCFDINMKWKVEERVRLEMTFWVSGWKIVKICQTRSHLHWYTITGFDSVGNVVNKPDHGTLDWVKICEKSAKVITFIDLAGHERYLKTTVFGMTGHAPDFGMLMVSEFFFIEWKKILKISSRSRSVLMLVLLE